MRILMISDVYYPRVNGVSTSIQTFCRDLSQAGHDITLVAPDYATSAGTSSIDTAVTSLIRVPGWPVPYDREDRFMRIKALRAALAGLGNTEFSIVHIQTPFLAHYEGVRYARALQVPCVETYHTFFEEYFHHYLPVIPRDITRWLARRATRMQCNQLDGLISPSQAMLDKLGAYGITIPSVVIPTGLDLQSLGQGDGARFRAMHGIPADRFTLVHVGRLAFEKKIGFLLQALVRVRAAIPDVLLVISGEGPAADDLKRQVTALGLEGHVLFVGYLSRQDALADCYRAGDLFVFASRTETQGLVLLEAMYLGVPVVSLAYMGAEEILRPQRGAVIAQDDPSAFGDCVIALAGDPDRRRALSADGIAYAQSWRASVFAQRLAAFYEQTRERCTKPVVADQAHAM